MLSPKAFKVIPNPEELTLQDVYELIHIRAKRHQPWLKEAFIGPGFNHPLMIFKHQRRWVNMTTEYKTREEVIEYLSQNPEAFNRIDKSFHYAKEKPMRVQEIIKKLLELDPEAETNIVAIAVTKTEEILLLNPEEYSNTSAEVICFDY